MIRNLCPDPERTQAKLGLFRYGVQVGGVIVRRRTFRCADQCVSIGQARVLLSDENL